MAYNREKKEVSFNGVKFDVLSNVGNTLVVGEVKKSSGSLEAAKMQLYLYLKVLSEAGLEAVGELRIPEEKKRIKLELNEEVVKQLEESEEKIEQIIKQEMPPQVIATKWCKKCAYNNFCYA